MTLSPKPETFIFTDEGSHLFCFRLQIECLNHQASGNFLVKISQREQFIILDGPYFPTTGKLRLGGAVPLRVEIGERVYGTTVRIIDVSCNSSEYTGRKLVLGAKIAEHIIHMDGMEPVGIQDVSADLIEYI